MTDIGDYGSLDASDQAALTALCTEYCWLRDYSQVEKIPLLFTEDCLWIPPAGLGYAPVALEGRQALADALSRRNKDFVTRTLISNLRFVKDGPDTARGSVNFTIYAAHRDELKVPIPQMIGDWLCTFRKGSDGRWRFATKKTELAFGGLRVV
jgi:ketosteroid isomerase-like protein